MAMLVILYVKAYNLGHTKWRGSAPLPILSLEEKQSMITLAEQLVEAQRELALRRQCYPGWVKRGKLDSQDAYHQLQVMEAIVRTLRCLDGVRLSKGGNSGSDITIR